MKLIKRYKSKKKWKPNAEVCFLRDWLYRDTYHGIRSFDLGIVDKYSKGDWATFESSCDRNYDFEINWLNQMIKDGYIEIINSDIFEWETVDD